MKKTVLVLFLSFMAIPFFMGNVAAGWKLYDNFNSYTTIADLNLTKWEVDDSSADITIENGQARFDHLINHSNDSSWLKLRKNPKKIKGIRTKVRCTSLGIGTVRARIGINGGYGQDDGYIVWEQLCIQYDPLGYPGNVIYGSLSALDQNNNDSYMYGYHYSEIGSPIVPVIDETYTLTMIFSRTKVTFIVKGDINGKWGKLIYSFPKKLDADDTNHRGIGTRSNDDDGSCTVYFDDVYVLRP